MKRVLVVDDAVIMRLAIKIILEQNGHKVIGEAVNGHEAVKKYTEFKPDIVTMDITMPVMDGLHAVKEIIKIDPQAKILMISAMGQESMVREAIMNGAKNFIVKPFNEDVVIKAVNKL